MNYDIIGDLHGQADKLHALLARMGYEDRGGSYRHPDRTAIFVGDFIDRGDRQLDTLNTVRRMVDAGRARAITSSMPSRGISPTLPCRANTSGRVWAIGAASTARSTRPSCARWSTGPRCTPRSSTGF